MNRRSTKKNPKVARHLVPERQQILEFLTSENKPRNLKKIARAFAIESPETRVALERRLLAMQRDGQIIKNRREGYGLANKMDLLRGRVIAHPDGYGFLKPEQGGNDLYLSAREMRSLLHGDRILAHVTGVDKRGRLEGALVEILERANRQVVGRYFREGNIGFVVPDNKRIHQNILISAPSERKIRSGEYVVAKIVQQPDKHTQPIGEITEVLGRHMSPDLAVEIVMRSFEIPGTWPEKLEKEIRKISPEVNQADTKGREDIRVLPLVTIDGEDARDFDDAVYCEKQANGWRLIVAIADVSHYVRKGGVLDEEARTRGNSVYFPRKVIPMLPEILSNELCSLNPVVDRLCVFCELIINRQGKVIRYRFSEGVMQSSARMTYTEAAKILLEKDKATQKKYKNLLPHIENLYRLYQVMHKFRESNAVIDFSSAEIRFFFDEKGNVETIEACERNDAHRLIEEFMLAANVAAAEYLLENALPALYRVHATPGEDKLKDLQGFLGELGLALTGADNPTAKDYAKLLKKISKREDKHLIETVLLRSMPLAVYDAENIGHFGLGFPAYTHFTSPIRRYPDLLVHRAIHHLIHKGNVENFNYSQEEIQALGTHCSMTERRAEEATREIAQWYKCQFMSEKVGETFEGTISGVTSFGVFVELDNIFVEGLVHITSLPIDYYHFDPVGHRLRGERSGRLFRLGNRIRVKLVRVDVDEKKIDFEMIEN